MSAETAKKNHANLVAATLVVFVVLACVLWQLHSPARGAYIAIHEASGQVQLVSLERDSATVIKSELGTNTIVVQNGKAHIEDADCPNGDCMYQAAISQPGEQLICLPHKLWVEVLPSKDSELGQMDVASVTPEESLSDDVDTVAS